jgi:hypothetical protein
MSNVFYVYEHWRLDKDECFYVGKGRGGRAYTRSGRNIHWRNIVNKLERNGFGYSIQIVQSGMTEKDAFRLEKDRIFFWRDRVDLCNKTDGGDGISGYLHSQQTKETLSIMKIGRPGVKSMLGKKHSKETREKMSLAQKGVPKSIEHAAKVGMAHRGKIFKHSDETRAKMSAIYKGRKLSDKARENMKAGWIKRKAKAETGML